MEEKTIKKIKRGLTIGGITVIAIGGVFGIYCATYEHADEYASECIKSDESVEVIKNGKDYIFKPNATTGKGLIFYPGGKVETKAYAPLMKSLAKNGIYCVLPHMSCNLAFFSKNAAKNYIKANPSISFYVGGHSLGGVAASSFSKKNTDRIKGLVMLASYSTDDLSGTDLKTISITATNDEVLNWKSYEKYKSNLPNVYEYSIEGGIHSYFGSYGIQKGDGTPTITVQEQTSLVAEVISTQMYM